jgi:hypothetical protein
MSASPAGTGSRHRSTEMAARLQLPMTEATVLTHSHDLFGKISSRDRAHAVHSRYSRIGDPGIARWFGSLRPDGMPGQRQAGAECDPRE